MAPFSGATSNQGKRDQGFEKSFLFIVAIIVPLELAATWIQGRVALSPYLYFFSIYQHLQYVPVIMVTGYILGLFSLWNQGRWRALILAITPLMGIYVSASMSMAALGFSVLGALVFLASRIMQSECRDTEGMKCREVKGMSWMPLLLFMLAFVSYNYYVSVVTPRGSGGMYSSKISESGLSNVIERGEIWKHYVEGFFRDPALLLFGHSSPIDREFIPSAHNYYLDFIYNFGLLAMTPILWLIAYTLWVTCRNWRAVISSRSTMGFAFVVGVLLLCENNVKVSLRMPYSGIVIFFLWGLLLSRLDVLRNRRAEVLGAE